MERDLKAISALPIGAFFREGWLPLTERDGKPILVVNGVEHDAAELLRRFAADVMPTVTDAEIKAFRDKHREIFPGAGFHDRQTIIELLTASKQAVAAASDAFRAALQEPRHDR